jgi:hypothetical protein
MGVCFDVLLWVDASELSASLPQAAVSERAEMAATTTAADLMERMVDPFGWVRIEGWRVVLWRPAGFALYCWGFGVARRADWWRFGLFCLLLC